MSESKPLSRFEEYALAVVGALSVANAYYIHPIVREVAAHFQVTEAEIGIVPALNQIALAVGILLLLPLGDKFGNRRLVFIFSCLQAACLFIMAFASNFLIFTAASTLLGGVTIAPYLLPAYASKRTHPKELGRITALLTAGVLFGILYARAGAGVLAEYFGWQLVYYLASGLMLILVVTLRFLMRARERQDAPTTENTAPTQTYGQLLASLLPLLRQYPEAALSGLIQAANFGIFVALWLGLALHLTSPQMGYSVAVVGYLAFTAGVSMITTPRLGILTDKMGPERARFAFATIQILAMVLMLAFENNLALLMIPILMNTIIGPVIDVSGRMTLLRLDPAVRTRLITIYISIMFIGGGIASTTATTAYAAYGWSGNIGFAISLAIIATLLSAYGLARNKSIKK